MAALVHVDLDAVLKQLQATDPLSWHCGNRSPQQHWFWSQRGLNADRLPQPRTIKSAPPSNRPSDNTHRVQRCM